MEELSSKLSSILSDTASISKRLSEIGIELLKDDAKYAEDITKLSTDFHSNIQEIAKMLNDIM